MIVSILIFKREEIQQLSSMNLLLSREHYVNGSSTSFLQGHGIVQKPNYTMSENIIIGFALGKPTLAPKSSQNWGISNTYQILGFFVFFWVKSIS
jgi:hypothetical protein